MDIPQASTQAIKNMQTAVQALKAGGLVAVPTETVYGLAARASNPSAIHKLYAAKDRDFKKPLTLQLADTNLLHLIFKLSPAEQLLVDRLANHFWPGPLSIVAPKAHAISGTLTGGSHKVALRIPAHPVALALLKGIGEPLAITSVNRSGEEPLNCAQDIQKKWGEIVEVILEDEFQSSGRASSVVDISEGKINILRDGEITLPDILKAIG